MPRPTCCRASGRWRRRSSAPRLAPLETAGKLGYVLFQLAPWVRFDAERLDYLASLPARLPGMTVAVEGTSPRTPISGLITLRPLTS